MHWACLLARSLVQLLAPREGRSTCVIVFLLFRRTKAEVRRRGASKQAPGHSGTLIGCGRTHLRPIICALASQAASRPVGPGQRSAVSGQWRAASGQWTPRPEGGKSGAQRNLLLCVQIICKLFTSRWAKNLCPPLELILRPLLGLTSGESGRHLECCKRE